MSVSKTVGSGWRWLGWKIGVAGGVESESEPPELELLWLGLASREISET